MPDDVRAAADVVLDTPHDAATVLAAIARSLGSPSSSGARPRRYVPMTARAASAAASRSAVGKSPSRMVSAPAAASPLQSSPPWRSAGASLVESRMNM